MQNYDKAYELAKEIKESEVYQSYLKAKEEAFSNELNKNLYDKYTELTRQVMGAQMAGQPVTCLLYTSRCVLETGCVQAFLLEGCRA